MRWALCLCVLDHPWHAVEERGDHPDGLQAVCGHRWLPAPVLHDEPLGPPCQECAAWQLERAVLRCEDDQISGRPPVELPPPPRSPRPAGPDGAGDRALLGRFRRAGRHRSTSRGARVTRRFRTIELVDARTLLAHELTPDALDAGYAPRGRYVALCGAVVRHAEPGQDRRCLRYRVPADNSWENQA